MPTTDNAGTDTLAVKPVLVEFSVTVPETGAAAAEGLFMVNTFAVVAVVLCGLLIAIPNDWHNFPRL